MGRGENMGMQKEQLTLPTLVKRGIIRQVTWGKGLEGYVRLIVEIEKESHCGQKECSLKYMMV